MNEESTNASSVLLPILIVLGVVIGGVFVLKSLNTGSPETTSAVLSEQTPDTTNTITAGTPEIIKGFKINASNFSFSQTEIRVKKGDKVKIELTSVDGFHDWVVDEFSAKTTQINTGETATVEFVADKVGEFEYYCSVGKHREMGMVGKLIVE